MCAKIEALRDRPERVWQFDMLFASVYEVAELLGAVGPFLVLNIMPYLVHRGDSDNLFDRQELSSEPEDDLFDEQPAEPEIVPDDEFVPSCPFFEFCLLEDGQHSECEIKAGHFEISEQIHARLSSVPIYQAQLELARINAHALNGMGTEEYWEEFVWANCDEDCLECEFADNCDWGKCVCTDGYGPIVCGVFQIVRF